MILGCCRKKMCGLVSKAEQIQRFVCASCFDLVQPNYVFSNIYNVCTLHTFWPWKKCLHFHVFPILSVLVVANYIISIILGCRRTNSNFAVESSMIGLKIGRQECTTTLVGLFRSNQCSRGYCNNKECSIQAFGYDMFEVPHLSIQLHRIRVYDRLLQSKQKRHSQERF